MTIKNGIEFPAWDLFARLQLLDDGTVCFDSQGIVPDYQTTIRFLRHLEEYVSYGEEAINRLHAESVAIVNSPLDRDRPEKPAQPGFVYLLRAADGLYKIGLTKSPETRIPGIQKAALIPVVSVALILTDDMHSLERELHERFAQLRHNGEWFNLSLDDVEYIKGLVHHDETE